MGKTKVQNTTTVQYRNLSSRLITPQPSPPLSLSLSLLPLSLPPTKFLIGVLTNLGSCRLGEERIGCPISLSPPVGPTSPSPKLCNCKRRSIQYHRGCRHRHQPYFMRKVIHFSTNATAPAPLLPPPPLLPSSNSSPPSNDIYRHAMSFFPPIPVLDYSAFDLATVALISGLLLLSILSVSFIFHLRLKSRSSDHLRNFNSLWTVRFLLISFITLWALNEIIRLPIFRQHYLYPFLPFLTISQQANLCKTHVVLSLGFFEPGFLVTLLFLVNTSIKKRNAQDMWAIASISLACLPIFLLQTLFVFFSPSEVEIPDAFRKSFVLSMDDFGNKTVLCTYPLLNTTMFGAFGIAYSLGLLLSCWRVVSLVINKALRIRIHLLALAVTIFLPLQILLMGLSALCRPEKPAYGGVMLAMCVCMTVCAVVGEGVLVIKPVVDALAAGGDCCRWSVSEQVRQEIHGQRTVDGMRQ